MPRLNSGDISLHYQVQGEGDPLVLIHGLGANMAFWYMGIARVLAARFKVITYDLRGHGRSSMPPNGYNLPGMAGDLNRLLNHLHIDKAHVVGHSFGARVAMHFSLRAPDRVASLVVADTQASCLQSQVRLRDWPHWKTWKKQLNTMGFHALPPEDELITFEMLKYFNELSADFSHGALNQDKPAGHRPSLKKRDMGRKGSARWDRLMAATTAQRDFSDDSQITDYRVQAMATPTLAMFGELSHCLASCETLERYVDNCEVTILPEVGHFHPAVKPRLFTQKLIRFLDRHAIGIEDTPVRKLPHRPPERRVVAKGPASYPMGDRFGNPVIFDRRTHAETSERRNSANGQLVHFPFRDRYGIHVCFDRRRAARPAEITDNRPRQETARSHTGVRLRNARRRLGR